MPSAIRMTKTPIEMPHNSQLPVSDSEVSNENHTSSRQVPAWLLDEQPARICFLVATVALTAAACSWLVNFLLSGWMEIAGLAAIGLFYLSLGLLSVGRRSPTEGDP